MIMGKLDIRTIYIIFASAFLVNPVLLQNSTTISTSQSSSQVPPSTTMAITTTIVTTPSTISTTETTTTGSTTTPLATTPTITTPLAATTPMPASSPITTPLATTAPMPTSLPTTMTQPTTTTTTATTTTAVPIEIGKNCSSSPGSCESNDLNSECKEEKCQCKDGFFELVVNKCEPLTSLLPTSLSLNSTETTITVAWVRPTGLNSSEYQLEYKVSVKGDNFDQTNTTTEENITVSGLTAGQIYNVYVLTIFNDSIPSESVNGSIATRPKPPGCPLNGNYNAPNITITWTKPGVEVQGYLVQFGGQPSFNVTSEMAEIQNLVPGRNYTLTLNTYAYNMTSNSSTCYIRTESEVPDPPKNVTIAGTLGKDNFNISITAPDELRGDIAGYRIFIYGKSYMDEKFAYRNSIIITDTMDNIYHVTGLQAGTFYNIQVYTINDKFNSSDSFNLTGIIRTAQNVPENITKFTSIPSNESFKITFERPNVPNGDIIGYRIRVSEDKDCIKEFYLQNTSFSPSDTCSSPATNSSITLNQEKMVLEVTALEPSIDYIVKIWAYTSVGEGSPFTVTVMTGISAPYKPGNVKAVGKTQSVLVTWTAPDKRTGKTSYIVEAFDFLNSSYVAGRNCSTPTFTATSCIVPNLEDFWRYRFQVTAKVGNWTNTSDKTAVITTLAGTPGKPARFVASLEKKGCKATLSWWTPDLKDRNANIDIYTIFIDSDRETYTVNDHDPYNKMNTQFFKTFTFRKETTITILIFAGFKKSSSDEKDAELRYVDTHDCYDPLTGGEIAGIIICVLLLLAVFGMVGFMVHRRWECVKEYLPEFGRRQSSGEFEPLQPPPERYRPIVLSAIGDFLRKYHADDNRLFIGEYEDLKQLSPRHTTNSANLDENKPKNRYTNILPYDHSRVILAPMVDEEDSSDYINANYIPGYTYGKEFIASQGPLPGTANDFWRMIWEQSVSIIVMLTKCSENNMDKCEHYWPHAANEPKCYNDLMVNVTSVSNMGKYDIHIMDVCLGDEKRVVKHFHFLEWPDFSAKVETTTLIEFITTVRQHITPDIKGPTVTHCSAGVGRTGTFITVDYLMQYVEDHDLSSQVDIFDWVIQMRDHRTTMVQTWAQYAFIHDCLSEIVERKKKLQNPEENGEVCIDNLAYEPDDLYENTKLGPLQTEL